MIHFFKYTVRRLGEYSLIIGLVGMIGTLLVVGLDMPFYLRAVEVEAQVERIELQCSLRWRTVGSGGKSKTMESDRMECGKAREIKAGDPMAGYKLVEHRRSLLSYVAPDATSQSQWSPIDEFEGRTLESGDRFVAMVDPTDPTAIRSARGIGDLIWAGGALAVFFAMSFLGWLFKGIAGDAGVRFSPRARGTGRRAL